MPNLLASGINVGRLVARRVGRWYGQGWRRMQRWTKSAGDALKGVRASAHRARKVGYRTVSGVRWSAMRRRGSQARALLKLSINVRSRSDRVALSSLENHLVRRSAGMDRPIWISPHVIERSVREIVPANVVTFADLSPLLRPVAAEPTINFIDEIVRQGRPYEDTTLFHQVRSGKGKAPRKRLGAETVPLTVENFPQYFKKCLRQAEAVAKHGLRPWDKSQALSYDGDIAVLLSDGGELMFLRRGTHRLGIARALRLQHIPVQIFMVTGAYLADSADGPRWYLPWRLPDALRRACARTFAARPVSELAVRDV